jgi:hypothetical protein
MSWLVKKDSKRPATEKPFASGSRQLATSWLDFSKTVTTRRLECSVKCRCKGRVPARGYG